MSDKKVILSGMRPTGPLHLGHLLGTIQNWKMLQSEFSCYFMVADWHALMSEYESPNKIREYSIENVKDWLSCGIDQRRAVIFRQSDVAEHIALHMIFSIITPLSWLERCPTYKEQLREVKGRNLMTYGFLGYPVLQASDILLYRANAVPVGEDQLPHLELTREVAKRFNSVFAKDIFPFPEPILTKMPRVLGTDNRKMSKSYNNYIALTDSKEDVSKKVASMITDPNKIRKGDPGRPEVCNVFNYHGFFDAGGDHINEIYKSCHDGKLGCVDCKKMLAASIQGCLAPIQEARRLIKDDLVCDILKKGGQAAKEIAQKTMNEVNVVTGLR